METWKDVVGKIGRIRFMASIGDFDPAAIIERINALEARIKGLEGQPAHLPLNRAERDAINRNVLIGPPPAPQFRNLKLHPLSRRKEEEKDM